MTEFDQIVDFNEQLVLIANTGLPIDVHPEGTRQSIEQTISQLNARIGLRVTRGDTTRAAIQDDTDISPQYRQALLTLLRTGDTAAALDAATSKAQSQRLLKRNVSQWLFQTAIVMLLTLLAFLFTISFTNPKIVSFYQDMGIQEGAVLSLIALLRAWLPVWLGGLLVLIFSGWFLWRRYRNYLDWAVIPGGKSFGLAMQFSETAGQMASLLEQRISLQESLAICDINAKSGRIDNTNTPLNTDSAPLLRWALADGIDEQSRAEVLRFVSGIYRQKAERMANVWRFLVPSIATALVGGIVVLLYALSVFVPWIHFLEVIS